MRASGKGPGLSHRPPGPEPANTPSPDAPEPGALPSPLLKTAGSLSPNFPPRISPASSPGPAVSVSGEGVGGR